MGGERFASLHVLEMRFDLHIFLLDFYGVPFATSGVPFFYPDVFTTIGINLPQVKKNKIAIRTHIHTHTHTMRIRSNSEKTLYFI